MHTFYDKKLAEDRAMYYFILLKNSLIHSLSITNNINYDSLIWNLLLERHCCKSRHIYHYPELKRYVHNGLTRTKRRKYIIHKPNKPSKPNKHTFIEEYDLELMKIDNENSNLNSKQTLDTIDKIETYIDDIYLMHNNNSKFSLSTIIKKVRKIISLTDGFEYSLMRYFDTIKRNEIRQRLIRHRFVYRLKQNRGM
jgi:hypothetical protein